MKEIQKQICDLMANRSLQKNVSNQDIVDTINLLGAYLNAKTISNLSKELGKDYTATKNYIKKHNLQVFEIFNHKFVIDNE